MFLDRQGRPVRLGIQDEVDVQGSKEKWVPQDLMAPSVQLERRDPPVLLARRAVAEQDLGEPDRLVLLDRLASRALRDRGVSEVLLEQQVRVAQQEKPGLLETVVQMDQKVLLVRRERLE